MNGIDKFFSGMRISSTGLLAERARIDTIAENIANAQTTRTPDGGPYRRKMVVFEPLLNDALGDSLDGGVSSRVVEDMSTPFERVMDPGHPDADGAGMVAYPNVDTVMEMAELISAIRSYEANVTAQENFIRMAERALELAR